MSFHQSHWSKKHTDSGDFLGVFKLVFAIAIRFQLTSSSNATKPSTVMTASDSIDMLHDGAALALPSILDAIAYPDLNYAKDYFPKEAVVRPKYRKTKATRMEKQVPHTTIKPVHRAMVCLTTHQDGQRCDTPTLETFAACMKSWPTLNDQEHVQWHPVGSYTLSFDPSGDFQSIRCESGSDHVHADQMTGTKAFTWQWSLKHNTEEIERGLLVPVASQDSAAAPPQNISGLYGHWREKIEVYTVKDEEVLCASDIAERLQISHSESERHKRKNQEEDAKQDPSLKIKTESRKSKNKKKRGKQRSASGKQAQYGKGRKNGTGKNIYRGRNVVTKGVTAHVYVHNLFQKTPRGPLKTLLSRMVRKERGLNRQSNKRKLEWLHLIGRTLSRLTPLSQKRNPQDPKNLWVGQSSANRRMLFLEAMAEKLSLFKDLLVTVRGQFEIFAQSEVIANICYTVSIVYNIPNTSNCYTWEVTDTFSAFDGHVARPFSSMRVIYMMLDKIKTFLQGQASSHMPMSHGCLRPHPSDHFVDSADMQANVSRPPLEAIAPHVLNGLSGNSPIVFIGKADDILSSPRFCGA